MFSGARRLRIIWGDSMSKWSISRREVLKSVGVAVGLPLLEAMMPALFLGQAPARRNFPKRLAVVYVPNGVNVQAWTPARTGGLGEKLPQRLRRPVQTLLPRRRSTGARPANQF